MSETDTSVDTTTEIADVSLWKVVFHNDDFTPMDFVVEVLRQVFNKSDAEAADLMLTVHEKGSAVVGLYTKEVAVSKVRLVLGVAENYGHPLLATTEQA